MTTGGRQSLGPHRSSSPAIALPSDGRRVRLVDPRAVLRRFVDADGSSHARSLAYQTVFVAISGFIGLIGLASVLGIGPVRGTVVELSKSLAPGPSGKLLQEAASQGASGGATTMALGLGSALFAGVLAMAQLQRSSTRIAGGADDRRATTRYLTALVLALSAGLAMALGLLVLGGGGSIARGVGWGGTAATAWAILRWPLGLALAGAGLFALFRGAPRVRLAGTGGLVVGAAVSVVLWLVFTGALALYFSWGGSQSQVYGSLLSVVALILWAGASSTAVHVGLAVAAELGASGASAISVPETRR